MDKIQMQYSFVDFDRINDLLYSLETIIELTYNYCQNKELQSIYYNLSDKERIILSEERNHYINMLNIALEKIYKAKELNIVLENKLLK